MDEIVDIPAPLQGIDLSTESLVQRPLTTPAGVNVRTFAPLGERGRVGSRAGLSKYIDEQVNGDHVIQHLNIIVDPTTAALNVDDTVTTPERPFPDPSTNNRSQRNPGRFTRQGGSGRVPVRAPSPPPPPPPVLTYLRTFEPSPAYAGEQLDGISFFYTVPFSGLTYELVDLAAGFLGIYGPGAPPELVQVNADARIVFGIDGPSEPYASVEDVLQ